MHKLEPFNKSEEEALVGALFLNQHLVKECTIRPEQLYTRELRQIYSAIRSLDEKGKPVDLITLMEEVGDDNISSFGGASYFYQLAGKVPSLANFHSYEKVVREYDQKGKAIQIAEKIIECAFEANITKTLSEGISELMAVEEDQTNEDNGDITPSFVNLFEDCEKDLGDIVGIPSGFTHLDRLTGGFQESNLVIMGHVQVWGKRH
ncbi:DnaB-like helicase N-terminal domain-containing protein [Neobacillus sp. BF23-41]|uniref:DnaB-like helicase N-terminal domain-containing protein n=1 Tax=Neobacillus sp. BF23-41 TaxID=3240280 RepID=UPI0034E49328